MSSELVERVTEALAVDREEFAARVDEEVAFLKRELADGTFNNPQAIVGLEYEFYVVAWPPDRPATDSEETADRTELYADLFREAAAGLRSRGLTDGAAARYLAPLRERVRRTMTPARWKHRQVRSHVDGGADLATAVHRMQRTYVERQAETLDDGRFVDWLSGGPV